MTDTGPKAATSHGTDILISISLCDVTEMGEGGKMMTSNRSNFRGKSVTQLGFFSYLKFTLSIFNWIERHLT